MKKLLGAAAIIVLLGGTSWAAGPNVPPSANSTPPLIYQGTMTLGAASSTQLIAANATMATNSAALPAAGAFAKLTVINTGATNAVYVCWFGGTASTTSGCEPLAPGASDTVNIAGVAAAPTFYSTSGTTLAFHN
jgi:hypothetical protein